MFDICTCINIYIYIKINIYIYMCENHYEKSPIHVHLDPPLRLAIDCLMQFAGISRWNPCEISHAFWVENMSIGLSLEFFPKIPETKSTKVLVDG